MALMSLSQAHLAYGHVPLLHGASLALEGGERLALIGRNGIGKSSLLKVLAGLEKLDDGLLQLQGQVRRVWVAQEPEFADGASVFEAVSEGLAGVRALRERYEALTGSAQAVDAALAHELDELQTRLETLGGWTWEQRVQEALQRLHLNASDRVDHLSGGTRKRVALAQTLVLDPDIILMDEPFSALDIQTRQLMENEVLDLWAAKKKAVLFITHDLDEAIAMSDRVVVLSAGPATHPIGDFVIDLPRPRDVAEVRSHPRFVELHAQIWDVLREEVLKGYAQQRLGKVAA